MELKTFIYAPNCFGMSEGLYAVKAETKEQAVQKLIVKFDNCKYCDELDLIEITEECEQLIE